MPGDAGNSPGGMSYLLKPDERWIAFSGDVMLAGGRMHNWFDTEWDYGFAAGLYTLIESASMLESFEPAAAAFARAGDPRADRRNSGLSAEASRSLRAPCPRLQDLHVRAAPTRTGSRAPASFRICGRSRSTCTNSSGRTSSRISTSCWPTAAGR